MATTNIYILRLQGGNYYIGKSNNPMKRYEEHLRGNGSSWTRLYKPIACERVITNASAFDEDKYTKEYMAKYGIEKVRGGTYVETELSKEQKRSLQKEIWAAQDKCTNCGKSGHYIKQCNKSNKNNTYMNIHYENTDGDSDDSDDFEYIWQCEKCDKKYTSEILCEQHERSCRGKNTYVPTKPNTSQCWFCGLNGRHTSDCYLSSDKTSKPTYNQKSISCYKCGLTGHYASDCYASTCKKIKYQHSYEDEDDEDEGGDYCSDY
jgi:predicted GIY-YIG superfamily endonuclease